MIGTANQYPLCRALRTRLGHRARSEKCQKRTSAGLANANLAYIQRKSIGLTKL